MANSNHQPRRPRKELPPAKPWQESKNLYGWKFENLRELDIKNARLIIRDAALIADADPDKVPNLVIEEY